MHEAPEFNVMATASGKDEKVTNSERDKENQDDVSEERVKRNMGERVLHDVQIETLSNGMKYLLENLFNLKTKFCWTL